MATNPRNAGRPYYACAVCRNWYRWGDGLGSSPRNSPTTSPTIDQAPAPSQPVGGHEQAGDHCHQSGCLVKRVGRQCQRRMCRKHCRAAGGCLANGHTSSRSPPLPPSTSNGDVGLHALPSSTSSDLGTASSSTSLRPLLSAVSLQPQPSSSLNDDLNVNPASPRPLSATSSTVDLLAPSRMQVADPSINPRHASHLRPIFVEHVASVHERAEKKRQRDQELVQEKRRACERVIAFSFYANDAEPVIVDFQDGFSYPYFRLSRPALVDLDLIPPKSETTTPAVHYFDPALDTWVKMKIDNVIELTKPSQRLFFKGLHVTSYPRFNQLFESAASRNPNLRLSLSQERSHVKQTQTYAKARSLDTLDALLELSSDEESNDSPFTPLPKKCRTESNQRQQASEMPQCDPACHDLQSRHHDAPFDNDDDISLHDDDSIVADESSTHTAVTARRIPGIQPTAAKFPTSFYAIDIHAAFCFTPKNKLTVESQFQHFFGVCWKSSTYYDHKARWYNAPQDARDRAIAAGYSDAGRYSSFLTAHPAKDAELKATKRKLRASQHN
ncbi:hypothetical protein L210DRAFT_3642234 [Boletus edulis BED1]|uniref:Uncharacterized protein n=1 Tax=Boletus edulis BED1 TaxID=1328754 RepID=A0AAD4C279_BOLED|nr:hypothetical protein L210DRAFT_3642234 [Boletus edulis BED1]